MSARSSHGVMYVSYRAVYVGQPNGGSIAVGIPDVDSACLYLQYKSS